MVDVGCWMLEAGCWMMDTGCWMMDTGCWMMDTGCWLMAGDFNDKNGWNGALTFFVRDFNSFFSINKKATTSPAIEVDGFPAAEVFENLSFLHQRGAMREK
jgi:hypothetical protein